MSCRSKSETFRREKNAWNIVVSSTWEFWNLRFKDVYKRQDNAIQSYLESEMQQPIPQYAKNLGYTQKRWEKTFYFHPWILSFEENPPNLRYVADYVNDEFTVYFAKKHGRWRAYWDAECQKVIEES